MTTERAVTIPRRYCGPPSSANGGWTAGLLADALATGPVPGEVVTVSLRRPPPLDEQLSLSTDGAEASLLTADGTPVALGRRVADSPDDLDVVEPVSLEQAREAEGRYAGLTSHPFPGCFVCGTDRAPGDGLRIFPGRVDDDSQGRVRVAATWTAPDGDDRPHAHDDAFPLGWAALDCVGGWAGDLSERLMVLGTMTASLWELPEPGLTYTVVGGDRGTEGRKTRTVSALHGPDGTVAATAEHVWIAIDPKDFA